MELNLDFTDYSIPPPKPKVSEEPDSPDGASKKRKNNNYGDSKGRDAKRAKLGDKNRTRGSYGSKNPPLVKKKAKSTNPKLQGKFGTVGPGTRKPKPKAIFSTNDFSGMHLHPRLHTRLAENGFVRPTGVQRKAIPLLMEGNDVMAKACTGSGKTLSYLVPIIHALLEAGKDVRRENGTVALLVAPTRELCSQIETIFKQLTSPFPWLVSTTLCGGEKRSSEKARLRKGEIVVIGTPGRINDHLVNTSAWKHDGLKWLVLDEADRLLDMGFEPQLKDIIRILDEHETPRQNALCSATLSQKLSDLGTNMLKNPKFVDVDDNTALEEDAAVIAESLQHAVPDRLQQFYVIPPTKTRLVSLAAFLKKEIEATADCKIIVFMASRASVEFVFTLFSNVDLHVEPPRAPYGLWKDKTMKPMLGVPLFMLHGSLSQTARVATFQKVNQRKSCILFTTDVAARGLDLPGIDWIVQYDIPCDHRAYVHRIGRTARIGKSGKALLFLQPSEQGYLELLAQSGMTLHGINPMKLFSDLITNQEENTTDDKLEERGILGHLFEKVIETCKEADLRSMAIIAYQAFLKSYTTHPKFTQKILNIRNLHLGHLARSFGLKGNPSQFTAKVRVRQTKEYNEQLSQGRPGFKKRMKTNAKTGRTSEKEALEYEKLRMIKPKNAKNSLPSFKDYNNEFMSGL